MYARDGHLCLSKPPLLANQRNELVIDNGAERRGREVEMDVLVAKRLKKTQPHTRKIPRIISREERQQ